MTCSFYSPNYITYFSRKAFYDNLKCAIKVKMAPATHTAAVCKFWVVKKILGGHITKFVWQGSMLSSILGLISGLILGSILGVILG